MNRMLFFFIWFGLSISVFAFPTQDTGNFRPQSIEVLTTNMPFPDLTSIDFDNLAPLEHTWLRVQSGLSFGGVLLATAAAPAALIWPKHLSITKTIVASGFIIHWVGSLLSVIFLPQLFKSAGA